MTIKEAIYQVQHLLAKSQISDDHNWSNRWIYGEILKYRARLVSQKIKNRDYISQEMIQETPCLNLIEVSDSDCPCDEGDSCYTYRTEFPLPNSITPYVSVQNTTGTKTYQIQNLSNIKFRKNTRFKSLNKSSFCYIKVKEEGNYVFIVTDNPSSDFKIVVRSIWEDPIEIQRLSNCKGESQNSCKSNYQLDIFTSESMFVTVKEMIIKNYLPVKNSHPDDMVNNNNDGNQPNNHAGR